MVKKIVNIKFCFIFLFLGLAIFFCKNIASGFDLLPGDNIDSRYINYIFEHFWLWFNQIEPHKSLWDMPCLYPAKNTLAYSDVLFGLSIFYIPIRFFTNAYNSFLITVLIACIMNFLTFYFLLKNCFKFKDLSSSAGAFFYAFSVIRYAQMCHVQLLSQFYTILALICFLKSKNYKYLSFIGCIFFALQFYTSFYLGWFIVFAGIILTIAAVCFKNERNILFEFLKNNYKYIFLNLCFTFLILLPLAVHYLNVGVTKYPFDLVLSLAPPLKNYFINQSLLDNFLFFKFENLDVENIYGIGIFTTLLILLELCGIQKFKKLAIVLIIVIFATVNIIYLQKLIYDYFPAGGAIRALGRFVNILCPLFAFILANLVERINKNALKNLLFYCL